MPPHNPETLAKHFFESNREEKIRHDSTRNPKVKVSNLSAADLFQLHSTAQDGPYKTTAETLSNPVSHLNHQLGRGIAHIRRQF